MSKGNRKVTIAGARQKPGETRIDLPKRNAENAGDVENEPGGLARTWDFPAPAALDEFR